MAFVIDEKDLARRGEGILDVARLLVEYINSNRSNWDGHVVMKVPRIVGRVVWQGATPIRLEFGYPPANVGDDRAKVIASVLNWNRKASLSCDKRRV